MKKAKKYREFDYSDYFSDMDDKLYFIIGGYKKNGAWILLESTEVTRRRNKNDMIKLEV